MRFTLPLLLAFGLLGTADASHDPAAGATRWVRTARGWETLASLDSSPKAKPASVAIHPGLVATGQLCGSLLALVACSPRKREAPSKKLSLTDQTTLPTN